MNLDVAYLTAWVTPNGQLEMRHDIYGYDNPRAKPINLFPLLLMKRISWKKNLKST